MERFSRCIQMIRSFHRNNIQVVSFPLFDYLSILSEETNRRVRSCLPLQTNIDANVKLEFQPKNNELTINLCALHIRKTAILERSNTLFTFAEYHPNNSNLLSYSFRSTLLFHLLRYISSLVFEKPSFTH